MKQDGRHTGLTYLKQLKPVENYSAVAAKPCLCAQRNADAMKLDLVAQHYVHVKEIVTFRLIIDLVH